MIDSYPMATLSAVDCPLPRTNGSPTICRQNQRLGELLEIGRLQFFYHSPSSSLPVRDVQGEQGHGKKKEPHIEKSAENYCRRCDQPNLRGFLRHREKYLFLCTKCMNKGMPQYGSLFIAGYILAERCERRPTAAASGRLGFCAVIGTTKLFSFEHSYPLQSANFRCEDKRRDAAQTRRILDHFRGKKNVLNECLEELKRLKGQLLNGEAKRESRRCRSCC